MRISRSNGLITLQDRAAPYWALGLFLLLGGLLAMMAPLGLATGAGELTLWQRAGSFVVGLGVCAGAVWWLRRCPASRVELDLARSRLSVARWGLSGRQVRELPFSDLDSALVEGGTDSEGGKVWRPAVRLRTGEFIRLSELWTHGERDVEDAVAMVAEACRLPRSYIQAPSARGV